MPRTLEQIDAALLDIEGERGELQALIAGIPAQETALLDEDADDDAFIKLDTDRKRAERALERLDRKETQLVQLAERYQAETQQRAYASARQRYLIETRRLAAMALEIQAQIETVNAISVEADRSGFSIMQIPTLPPVGYSQTGAWTQFGNLRILEAWAHIAASTPTQVPRIPPRQRTYPVRFLQWTDYGMTAYQRGQVAYFTGRNCRALVDAGRAEYMRKGMTFDAFTAAWGAGPAPPETKPPAVNDLDDDR